MKGEGFAGLAASNARVETRRGRLSPTVVKFWRMRPDFSDRDVAQALFESESHSYKNFTSFYSEVRRILAKTRKEARDQAVSSHARGYWSLNSSIAPSMYDCLNVTPVRGQKFVGVKGTDPAQIRVTRNGVVQAFVFRPETDRWRTFLTQRLTNAGWPADFAEKTVSGLQSHRGASHCVMEAVEIPPFLRGIRIPVKGYGLILVFGDKSHPKRIEIEFDRSVFPEFDKQRDLLLRLKADTEKILATQDELLIKIESAQWHQDRRADDGSILETACTDGINHIRIRKADGSFEYLKGGPEMVGYSKEYAQRLRRRISDS